MSGGTTETTSAAQPYGPLQPLLKTSIKDALKAYNKGAGANSGSMVVPMSDQTQAANNNLSGIADANSGGQGISGQYQGVINNGGFNDPMKAALDQYRSTATSQYNPNANPGFQGVLDAALRDSSRSVNNSAAAAGRYGSAIHQGELARATGDISSSMRSNDFNQFLGRKDAATAALGNLGQAGYQNLGTAYQGLQAPEQTRMGVGASYEDLYKRQLDDKARVQNLPWEQLSKLLAVGSGTGNYNTTTTTAPGPNPFLQTLGGVNSGIGILGNIFGG